MRGHAAGTERPRAKRRVMEPERGAERARSAPGRAAEERRHIEERQRSSEHGYTEPTRAARGNARYDELREARRRLNGEQRQKLRAAFDLQRGRVEHASFDWHVGHRLPGPSVRAKPSGLALRYSARRTKADAAGMRL